MGWLSDSLFGKRKKMDIDTINEFYKPYQNIVNQQGDIANQMLDSNSLLNQQRQGMLRQQQADTAGMQNQQTMKMGAMTGMSAGQMMANTGANNARSRGEMGMQFNNMLSGQHDRGLGLLGQVGQMRQGTAERESGQYMAEINAHNARRNSNMQMGIDAVGMAVSAATSDVSLKENIELVGKSPKGVNIYTFDYKNKKYGKGRYKGVMAQEVPNASFKNKDGYLWVDYNKLDVDFERVS